MFPVSGKVYRFKLYGHGFTRFPAVEEPQVCGYIEESEHPDYYKCTVIEQGEAYPAAWVGVYRLPKSNVESWISPESL